MIVYHGSYVEIVQPDISLGRFNLDFGKGYYVTTMQEQAEKWARRKGRMMSKSPVVSVYEFDDSDLDILVFNGYTEEWLDFVIKNRASTEVQHGYDAIFGNIADDDVAFVVNNYIRLLEQERISQSGKAFFIEQLQYSQPNNQYCIATQKGIRALKFLESYILEG